MYMTTVFEDYLTRNGFWSEGLELRKLPYSKQNFPIESSFVNPEQKDFYEVW